MRQRWVIASLLLVLAIGLVAVGSWTSSGLGGVPLDGNVALVVFALTETGSAHLVPIVLVLALALFATDTALDARQRRRESLRLLVVLSLALPAVAIAVETVVKPEFAHPRPSHIRMSELGIIPDLDAFYSLEKSARRKQLTARLIDSVADSAASALSLRPVILRHWVHEAGSTFPSAHAINAFVAATLFLGGSLASPTTRRRWIAALLLTWAICVSLSRVLLQVHRPVDAVGGAVGGAILGMVLAMLWLRSTQAAAKVPESHGKGVHMP